MRDISPSVKRQLVVKGGCRAGSPIYVLWGIVDWLLTNWLIAAVFAISTINDAIIFLVTWISPTLMNEPWHIRAWQIFEPAANAIVFSIPPNRAHGCLTWILFTRLCVASLCVGTAVYLCMQERLLMCQVFSAQCQGNMPPVLGPVVTPT